MRRKIFWGTLFSAILLGLGVFLLVGSQPHAAIAANLVQNSGFETLGTNGLPTKWGTAVFVGSPVFTSDNTIFYAGSRSVRIQADVNSRASLAQSVPVSPTQYYQLSVRVKTANIVSNDKGTIIRLQFSDANNAATGSLIMIDGPKGTNDWTQIRKTFVTPPGTTRVLVENFLWFATGTVWFDEVSVEQSTQLPAPVRFTANYYPGFNPRLSWLTDYGATTGLTVSVYNHSQPLTDANLGAATLVKSGIAVEVGYYEQPFDVVAKPYVGIVVRDTQGRTSSVLTAKLEPLPVLQTLKAQHPRLLASATDFTNLRNRISSDSVLQAWNTRNKNRANTLLNTPVVTYTLSAEGALLDVSRKVLDRMYILGLAYQMDGNSAYLERAWQELQAAGNFPDWHPDHYLDTAEMTHAFAIGYDWFYNAWTPARRDFIRNNILSKGLNIALPAYRNIYLQKNDPLYWEFTNEHNWNGVCNGGMGIGALAIADEVPYLSDEILQYARTYIQNNLRSFEWDGSYSEGLDYWSYATRYDVAFLGSLESAVGTDYGLSGVGGFSQAGFFPVHINGPKDKFYYGDAWPGVLSAPQLFWLGKKFKQEIFSQFQRSVASGDPLDILWYYPGPNSINVPTDRHFPVLKIGTWRSAWSDPNALFFGFKGRASQEAHNDLDGGTFLLDALGVRWAEELSADSYALPGYFDATKRWEYYRVRAEGQNTLVLNPDSSPDQTLSADTPLVSAATKPDGSFAVLDLTPAYNGKGATRIWRGFAALNNRSQVLIQDEITTSAPSELWWFMHTKAAISIAPGGKEVTLTIGTNRLWGKILTPSAPEISFTVRSATPLPTSPTPAGQNANAAYSKLAIKFSGLTNTRLAVLFVPLAPGQNPPTSLPSVTDLSKWADPSSATLWAQPLSGSSIRLDWTNAGDALGFRLERRPENSANWQQIKDLGATANTFTDTGLAANTRYYYRLQAYNVATAANYSPEANARTFSGGTLIVTNPLDNGATVDSGTPGTLSYALTQAAISDSKTILFNLNGGGRTIQVRGKLPLVSAGTTIYAGACGSSAPIVLDGSDAPPGTNGLELQPGSGIYISNLKITGFGGQLLKSFGGYQQLACFSAVK